ncbi:MAG: hypothetical protein E7K04_01585 [Helicobacter sp.]|nr:hypothetical protein [Helicobacter sp.]
MNDIWLFSSIILFIIIFVILAIAHVRHKNALKKISDLQNVAEKLSLENHKIQKNIKVLLEKQPNSKMQDSPDLKQLKINIKELQEMLKSDRSYFQEKLAKLENRIRDFNTMSRDVGLEVDEKRIIALFQEGFSIDSIAKELKIGRGEVEFILKLADI